MISSEGDYLPDLRIIGLFYENLITDGKGNSANKRTRTKIIVL